MNHMLEFKFMGILGKEFCDASQKFSKYLQPLFQYIYLGRFIVRE